MTEPRTYIYSSEQEPKLLRPAVAGEIHVWHRPDGATLILRDGKWIEQQNA